MKVVIWATAVESQFPSSDAIAYHGPFMTVGQAEKHLAILAGQGKNVRTNVMIENLKDAETRLGTNTRITTREKSSLLNSVRLMAVEGAAVKKEVVKTSGEKAA